MELEGNAAIGSRPADVTARTNQICIAPDECSRFVWVYNVCVRPFTAVFAFIAESVNFSVRSLRT